jgi:hypothetical protein
MPGREVVMKTISGAPSDGWAASAQASACQQLSTRGTSNTSSGWGHLRPSMAR